MTRELTENMFCENAALMGANMVILLVVELKVPDNPLPCKLTSILMLYVGILAIGTRGFCSTVTVLPCCNAFCIDCGS